MFIHQGKFLVTGLQRQVPKGVRINYGEFWSSPPPEYAKYAKLYAKYAKLYAKYVKYAKYAKLPKILVPPCRT